MKKIFLILFAAIPAALFSQMGIPGMKTDCHPQASYNFDGEMLLSIKTYEKGIDTIKMKSKVLVNSNSSVLGMIMGIPGVSEEGMTMVMDFKDSIGYMLMDMGAEKQGMCMDMREASRKAMAKRVKTDSSFDFTKYKKTGKTRQIMGYTCYEYRYESKDKIQSFWLTEDLKLSDAFNKAWGADGSTAQIPTDMKGIMLVFEMFDKKQGMTMIMEAISIDPKKNSEIKTEGFFKK